MKHKSSKLRTIIIIASGGSSSFGHPARYVAWYRWAKHAKHRSKPQPVSQTHSESSGFWLNHSIPEQKLQEVVSRARKSSKMYAIHGRLTESIKMGDKCQKNDL